MHGLKLRRFAACDCWSRHEFIQPKFTLPDLISLKKVLSFFLSSRVFLSLSCRLSSWDLNCAIHLSTLCLIADVGKGYSCVVWVSPRNASLRRFRHSVLSNTYLTAAQLDEPHTLLRNAELRSSLLGHEVRQV